MKKFLKKTSILLIGVLAVSVLLMSCSQVNDIKNGVKKGAEDVTSGIKEGAKDVKKGVEDITKSKAPLVGTWKGMQPNGEGYRVTLYEDSTYETLKYDKDNN
ncbi:MAG: hypothetical protein RR645_06570, partial [Clostridium sp.]